MKISAYGQIRLVSNVDGSDPGMDNACQGIVNLHEMARQHGGDRVEIQTAWERTPPQPGWLGRLWQKCTGASPAWAGRRVFDIVPDKTDKIDSQGREDSRPIGQFLGDGLKSFPQAMHVVHLAGHGRGYRQSAGHSLKTTAAALQQAVAATGRPIDLLLMESCLQSNLEALTTLAPLARYALVSEDSIPGMVLDRLTVKALRDLSQTPELEPRQLGLAALHQISPLETEFGGRPLWPDTLALIDLGKVPALHNAVGELGLQLAALEPKEVEAVFKQGLRLPVSPDNERQRLGFGDLKQIAQAAPDSARAAADKVLACLAEAVVECHADPATHTGTGGISVQLPGPVQKFESSDYFAGQDWNRFATSAAPDGWKRLVERLESQ